MFILNLHLDLKMVLGNRDGFFNETRRIFRQKGTALLKSWLKLSLVLSTVNQQLQFLLRCRRYDVLPPHIERMRFTFGFRSRTVTHKYIVYNEGYKRKLLKLEIKDANVNLHFLKKKIANTEDELLLLMPKEFVERFFLFNKEKIMTHRKRIKFKIIKKFEKIMYKYKAVNPLVQIVKDKWIINISNKVIPENVLNVLSLGDKFALPFNRNNEIERSNFIVDIIKNFEYSCFRLTNNIANKARDVICSLVGGLSVVRHVNCIDRYLSESFSLCKNFLRNNNDIMVTKADKGQTTVVMNKSAYIHQMNVLLEDQNTYKKLTKDPISDV